MTTRWDPFRDLMAIQERMNRLFQETMARQRGHEEIDSGGQWTPAVDILEQADRIVLRADLPGLEQSEIEVRVEDSTLTLRGDRRAPADVRPEDVHRSERPHGPFVRSFSLPPGIDQAGIRAVHRNGVLEVVLPKKHEARSSSIRVEVK
ncbi:MAG TPA: Hsp20/alpha crystallin family protein [Candidatus Polarisedimenticolia bacterium]|jgi:HSP20 family protein|nr:Hsp20/alpha crystallin family protein [Candidatus Polarisedimenticolia bacterium]